ncbi:GLYL3-like protein [Mya arenaria]|uniref:Glycine N-acyltransferase-like protein n=1 Tax=Mya arenaria TaxID=6604 RepID=A0ABY7FIQ8_MYAAR|nr:glycine-N-acyltransferase-like protein 3 [Mya arenaria]XP_052772995.1 glycine-N-acyltransferase-like protein 3 [Mya arenaria]WAR21047.1 GLYL3-like protein [Mya arenaria]WAR21054.1 GLYL3-like protein [Mya arenaria]
MIYKVLSHDEVEELNNELRSRLPGTAKIFYVIRSWLAGLLPGKEVIVDAWPEWTSIVLRTADANKVQPFFRHTYMCHARSASALKYFLQRPDVVDWRKPATFTGVPRDVAPVISTMTVKHRGRVTSLEPRFMYAWTKTELPAIPEIPEGLYLGKLRVEDATVLRRDWEGHRYREDMEGYFRTVIESFDSSCLRDASGELQAYACMQFNGSIAMLYVKPDHRDEDYFKIVLSDLARKRLENGEVAYGFIPTNDSDLVDQMRSIDFVWVPRGDMVWMHFEPLQVNRTNDASMMTSTAQNGNESVSFDCVCSDHAKRSTQKSFSHCRQEHDGSFLPTAQASSENIGNLKDSHLTLVSVSPTS